MSGCHSWGAVGIETASVIPYREKHFVAIETSSNLDIGCCAVSHGVNGEFADYAKDDVQGVVGEMLSADGKAHFESCSGQVLLKSAPDGLVD